MTVRPMEQGDVDHVLVLAADEPTAPHWPAFEYLRMLKFVAEHPLRRGAWVFADPEPVGFAIASHVAGAVDLEAVVVAPAQRGRGLGKQLVEHVMLWGRSIAAETLQLEVRESNYVALGLYYRLGFTRDGIRRAYYHNPVEDAVLMSLRLSEARPLPGQ